MKCLICKHEDTQPRQVTITLERDGTTLVFRQVPAQVCANCGEAYVDDATTVHLLESAELAAKAGVQVEVRAYSAA
ncbi:MAG TPA: type II toxin-antitoxin system MqsA family antitoxin [Aggregatilineales bacterium]|nr:type II toxin-antitoxin system MqsA family antitoxin [Anaerolineae bacterium]HUN09041.1 type II toxin-antitoxin system MqsA family antitoxin [Aggregatilineales bacterium]